MSTTYIVILKYIKPLEFVDAEIENHVKWLKRGYEDGAFIASGRQVPRVGGVIIAKSSNLDELQSRLKEDPFQKAGVVEVQVIPFEVTMKIEALEGVL